jgi:DNA polymerase-3 subunit alpha (Gram-positive type)
VGTAKITQVAALKIVDGVFKETFDSFVNPHEKLSERIVSLTDITDEMLADAPDVEPVLDDFRKFSDGAILVGHNIKDFDVPILNDRGKKFHIEFNNEIVDTLPLSHSLIKGLNNYKLKTITEFFGYKNEHEHRADADVLANARVFVELARLIK